MDIISQVWPEWEADEEPIGEGRYATVWRVSRTSTGYVSQAAVKVVEIPREGEVAALISMGMDEESIQSYLAGIARSLMREVAVMDTLKGAPGVVSIDDFELVELGSGRWTLLIRMELLEPLLDFVLRVGAPGPREVARMGADLCRGLAACHAAGVIHRDVKPANVFHSRFGEYKLGDFGVSALLANSAPETMTRIGSPSFVAPEVSRGRYGTAADIYSLGVMLYRMLNGGRPPFVAASGPVSGDDLKSAELSRLQEERPPLPAGENVDQALAAVVRRAVEPDPADRWQSAEALGDALRGWLDGVPADSARDRGIAAAPSWDWRSAYPGDSTVALYPGGDGSLLKISDADTPTERDALSAADPILEDTPCVCDDTLGKTKLVSVEAVQTDCDRSAVCLPNLAPSLESPVYNTTGSSRLFIGGILLCIALLVVSLVALRLPSKLDASSASDSSSAMSVGTDYERQVEPEQKSVRFELSFETGEGTRIESEWVEEGGSVYPPEDPTRDGYEFAGWFEDEAFASPVSFPFVLRKNVVLFAKWEEVSVLDGALDTVYSNEHTYSLYDSSVEWQEAEALCEELGGHLVTITAPLEQDVIEELVSNGSKNSYWIGGYLAEREAWQWVTGESFDFNNWAEGVPDNWILEGLDKHATEEERNDISASENAIVIYRVDNLAAPHFAFEWNDLASNGECSGEPFFGLENIGYICEWDSLVD